MRTTIACSLLILMTLVLAIAGCSSSSTNPTTSYGEIVPGQLKGVVLLYDSIGQAVSDKSGVLVELVGTPYSAVTDSTGLWTIKDIPTRHYIVKLSKPTFMSQQSEYTYVGGGTEWYANVVYPSIVRQRPPLKISFIAFTVPSSGTGGGLYFEVAGTFPTDGSFGVVTLVSTSPNAVPDDPLSFSHGFTVDQASLKRVGPNNGYSFALTATSNGFYGVKSGETAFVQLFPYIGRESDYKTDPATYNRIFYNTGEGSQILSGVVP